MCSCISGIACVRAYSVLREHVWSFNIYMSVRDCNNRCLTS